jgi:hypothetical protein
MGEELLFKAFKEEELFLGSPIVVIEGKVEAIDDVILGGVVVEVGEAAEAVVGLSSEYLDGLGDVALALIALYLVGRVEDVLSGGGGT